MERRRTGSGFVLASVVLVPGMLAATAYWLGDARWTSLSAGLCLLFCNWVLLGPLRLSALSPASVYLNILAVFHLGLVLPIAAGIAVGPIPAWVRSGSLHAALLLLVLALGCFAWGATSAAARGTRVHTDAPKGEWHNGALFYCGLAAIAAGGASLLWGIREMGFGSFMAATHFETYRLARTYDPRFFVTSLQLTPMGFYLALAAAPRERLSALAWAGAAWAGLIFVLGYRGFALTPVAACLVILTKRGVRLPRWAWAGGLAAVLIAIPMSRQLRDTKLSERTMAASDLSLAPLEAIQEMGGSLRPLIHTIDLMENEQYRWGRTYSQAVKQIVPNLSLRWGGDVYLPVEDLPPSHWVSRLAAPWNYRNFGGLGCSAVAEPYMNFGPWGVALAFWLLGYGLVRVDRMDLRRPTQLACLGMVLGPLLWATRNGSGVFVRPAIWGLALTLAARLVGDSLARARSRRVQRVRVSPRLRPSTNL
ncbi:MAG: O-antigen polysaccharide polymerase Wzy [Acidobacteria bacterium]|nr:O-antigen polysaccharide polymerase Wzy [Acidobacteriota bacterium]